jgi:formylglycine-generating enzyme
MIIHTPDSLRAAVEGATGGRVTVLYDDRGLPSYMVRIPKFNIEDVDPGSDMGSGVHPAFVVGGVEKDEIWIGQHAASVKGSRAVSLPGEDPAASLDYDEAVAYCTAKGPGWHLMTNWEWSAVALLCLKNEFQPRGNTNYGRHHDQTHETAVRQDGVAPGTASGTARTLTGSGPATWRHDGQFAGICDLVGNVWEWVGGFKLVDGRIYMPADNNYGLAEGSWPATSVYMDGTAGGSSGDVGDVRLATSIANATSDDGYLKNTWTGTATTAGYDALATSVKQQMQQACIDPTFDAVNPVGSIWARNHDERLPGRGGYWNGGADAGLFALDASYVRSSAYTRIGFRPAFIF